MNVDALIHTLLVKEVGSHPFYPLTNKRNTDYEGDF